MGVPAVNVASGVRIEWAPAESPNSTYTSRFLFPRALTVTEESVGRPSISVIAKGDEGGGVCASALEISAQVVYHNNCFFNKIPFFTGGALILTGDSAEKGIGIVAKELKRHDRLRGSDVQITAGLAGQSSNAGQLRKQADILLSGQQR